MAVSYKGYGVNCITMEIGDSVKINPGDLANVNMEGKLNSAVQGDKFIGVVTAVREGFATVQTAGYIEVGYLGEMIPGPVHLDCANKTLVKLTSSIQTSRPALAVKLDKEKKIVGLIL